MSHFVKIKSSATLQLPVIQTVIQRGLAGLLLLPMDASNIIVQAPALLNPLQFLHTVVSQVQSLAILNTLALGHGFPHIQTGAHASSSNVFTKEQLLVLSGQIRSLSNPDVAPLLQLHNVMKL